MQPYRDAHWSVVPIAALVAAMGCSGCWSEPASAPVVVQLVETPAPQPPPETTARLTAGEPSTITMFGELPLRGAVPYVALSATGLLQHTFAEEGADLDPELDRSGRHLVFASTRHSRNPDLYMKSVDGAAVTQLTADPASDVQPSFSPDGGRIAFASNRSGNWDIWVISLDEQQPQQVTRGAADDVHPSWSPDGARLVFCSLRPDAGQWELWIADAKSGASRTAIGYGLFPVWSPVDDRILFQRARRRGDRWFSIWTVELVDGEPRYPTEVASSSEFALISPAWSTNAKRIAYAAVPGRGVDGVSDEVPIAAAADIWVVDADGRARIRLTDGRSGNHSPTWSPDGRIFFTSDRGGPDNVWSLRVTAMGGAGERAGVVTSARSASAAAGGGGGR